MKTGETKTITARIGNQDVPISTLTAGLQTNGDTVATASTPTSIKMRMTLKSDDFEVTALDSEEQIVAAVTPTTWEWNVTPKHSGNLHLHLAAIVEAGSAVRDFTTVDRDIAVEVDPVDAAQKFIEKNWQWILSTIAASIALGWKLFGPKKDEARTASSV